MVSYFTLFLNSEHCLYFSLGLYVDYLGLTLPVNISCLSKCGLLEDGEGI